MSRAIAMVMLTWMAVTMDCLGRAEAVSGYAVRGQHVQLVGWTQDAFPNPIYTDRNPQQGVTTATAWSFSGSPLGPGDIVLWELDAIDEAGNWSGC